MTSPDAYDSTPARGSGPAYSRVYVKGGRVAHLMLAGGITVLCRKLPAFPCCLDRFCCCGEFPARMVVPYSEISEERCRCPHDEAYSRDTLLGTGSQDEIDHAAALPLCTSCFASREKQFMDPRLGTGHNAEMT